jgi:prolyl-tRNA synthetase
MDEFLEKRRREMQRTIQKKTSELRDQGLDKTEILSVINKIKRQEQKDVERAIKNFSRQEKGEKHDLVIIPILWRRHEKESLRLEEICSKLKHALMSIGLDTWVDGRRQYTPGQKFAYWEHLGIKVRIEIGPGDMERGVCQIVYAEKAGAYLEHNRKQVELRPKSVVEQIKELGMEIKMSYDRLSDDLLVENDEEPKYENTDLLDEDLAGNFAKEVTAPKDKKKAKMFGIKRRKSVKKDY